MRILYFDCFSGISGDMILGSLIDAGLGLSILKRELAKLNLGDFKLEAKRVKREDLKGTQFLVEYPKKKRFTDTKQIFSLIKKSSLKSELKQTSISLFKILEEKERGVHGIKKAELQLEQLGDADSIIDIVGSVIAFKAFGIEKIFTSPIVSGRSIGPATLELLKKRTIEYRNIPYELVTPTGALIIASLSEREETPPPFKINRVGYGAGSLELKEQPNLLRAIIGETDKDYSSGLTQDAVYVLETNIDDSNPIVFERTFERLYEIGCLEVYLTPVQMKKTRPGTLLTVLVERDRLNEAARIVFEETTTFGIRTYRVDRFRLRREVKVVGTKFGKLRMNIGYLGKKIISNAPEYEDCKRLAIKNKKPLKQILQAVAVGEA